jgi:hypothetical protein
VPAAGVSGRGAELPQLVAAFKQCRRSLAHAGRIIALRLAGRKHQSAAAPSTFV